MGTKVWLQRLRAMRGAMLKMLALSASVLAFASGLALAETTLSTGQWLASDVYKASVYDPSDHKIGKVTNLVSDSTGNVTAAIISVTSGFLGANQKDVVIPFKELKVSTRDGKGLASPQSLQRRTHDGSRLIIRALRSTIGFAGRRLSARHRPASAASALIPMAFRARGRCARLGGFSSAMAAYRETINPMQILPQWRYEETH
jgi:sporulation protein YlmC with PRC-barrel domain